MLRIEYSYHVGNKRSSYVMLLTAAIGFSEYGPKNERLRVVSHYRRVSVHHVALQ